LRRLRPAEGGAALPTARVVSTEEELDAIVPLRAPANDARYKVQVRQE
jgi:hypothetical protein